jgi:hypothetical protein
MVAACLLLLAFRTFAAVLYVDVKGTNPVSSYTSWPTAATNIQDAIDASTNGDLVLVTNGVYATGGRRWFDSGTNRVTLTNTITLQSVNGPAVTFIVGSQVVGTGSALTNAVRCVGIGNNAVLSGFTLTNGEAGAGNYPAGGGVAYIYGSGGGTVTNCVLIGNIATNSAGGGAYRVTLINCQIIGNYASEGGGACVCTLINCTVVSNTATSGGGVFGGTGFGASLLSNCTIVGNAASSSGGGVNGGGEGVMNNCIIYFNTAPSGSNYTGIKMNYCCTMPTLNGDPTSLTNAPLFQNAAASDFHLQSNSPCINSGNNTYVTVTNDLDGNPRIVGGTVDIGAYEYQTPASIISYAWLQQYGLPTDGPVDFSDLDGSGMNIYQDWIAGLNPTNPASVLVLQASATTNTTGITVTWQSVNTRTYYLQSSTNLPAFITIQSNIVGQAGTTSYTDTTATNGGPYFYRIGVQH